MLEIFYRACRSEGGTADEIHLRGLKAVRALAQPEPEVVGPTDDDLEGVFVDWAEWPDDESDRVLDRSTFVSAARDVLARWGRPAIQPVPVADPEAASQWPAHWSRAQREREAQSLCLQAGIDPVQQKRLCRYARDGMPLQDIHDLIAAEPDSRPSQQG
jgi:hypothetical protein